MFVEYSAIMDNIIIRYGAINVQVKIQYMYSVLVDSS